MFFSGETVTNSFVLPFSANEIDYVILSYKQNGSIIFEKKITSGFISEAQHITRVEFAFSQAESLLFDDNLPFTIQCNVLTKAGSRHASHEMKSTSGVQYVREVLNNA